MLEVKYHLLSEMQLEFITMDHSVMPYIGYKSRLGYGFGIQNKKLYDLTHCIEASGLFCKLIMINYVGLVQNLATFHYYN